MLLSDFFEGADVEPGEVVVGYWTDDLLHRNLKKESTCLRSKNIIHLEQEVYALKGFVVWRPARDAYRPARCSGRVRRNC